jgi:nitroreductase
MNTFDAISGFKMYRGKLDARKLEEGHLRRILEAALWAPSGHNSQPWEFVIVDDPELIQRIAEITTELFDAFLANSPHLMRWVSNFHRWLRWSREELESHGDGIYFQRQPRSVWEELDGLKEEAAIRDRLIALFGSRGQASKLIGTAPCLVFTLLDTEREIPDYSNDMLALTSAGAAMQNLRLAAFELGIAVHEQSVLYDLPETREALGQLLEIPGRCKIVGGMRLGYRAKAAKSSFTHVRRPVADVMHRNRY